jgi:hypothetical protein
MSQRQLAEIEAACAGWRAWQTADGQFAAKYAPLVPVLEELISRADTPLSAEVKAHIMGQLEAARQRFAAIMSTA